MLRGYVVTHDVLASAVRTTSGQTNSYRVDEFFEGIVFVDVTGVAGGGALVVQVECSPDDVNFYELPGGTFTSIAAASKKTKCINNFGKYLRLLYTITGTSVTFSIAFSGKAHD